MRFGKDFLFLEANLFLMKKHLLPILALALIITSCQKPVDEELPDTPPVVTPNPPSPATDSIRKIMLIEQKTYKADGSVNDQYYTLYVQDSVNRTITEIYDSVLSEQTRRYYDVSGRLEKIVYQSRDEDDPTIVLKDSVIFSRPSANEVQWEYKSEDYNATQKAIISNLAAGAKQVRITSSEYDPVKYYSKLTLNATGALDSLLATQEAPSAQTNFTKVEVTYNAGGVPVSKLNTTWQTITSTSYTNSYTITKDAKPNTFLNSFIDRLCGTDLAWMPYYWNTAPTGYFDYSFTDKLFLLKGTPESFIINLKEYRNGVFHSDNGTWNYQFPVQYDSNGRIISSSLKIDGKLEESLTIKYF